MLAKASSSLHNGSSQLFPVLISWLVRKPSKGTYPSDSSHEKERGLLLQMGVECYPAFGCLDAGW